MEQLPDISLRFFLFYTPLSPATPDELGFFQRYGTISNIASVIMALTAIFLTISSRNADYRHRIKEHDRRYYVLIVVEPVAAKVAEYLQTLQYLVEAERQALGNASNNVDNHGKFDELYTRFGDDFGAFVPFIEQSFRSWGDLELARDLEKALDTVGDRLSKQIENFENLTTDSPEVPSTQILIQEVLSYITQHVRQHDPVSKKYPSRYWVWWSRMIKRSG